MFRSCILVSVLTLCVVLPAAAQQAAGTSAEAVVPPMVNFSGVLSDANRKALTGLVGVTFSLYKDAQGGAPLWMETQNVRPDKAGRYSVMLGSSSSQGLPANVFAAGEARWVGVRAQGQEEQPRFLLVAVPYALKALDAETVGGKPASAFVLAGPGIAAAHASGTPATQNTSRAALPPLGGSGQPGFIPEWLTTTKLGDSALFQSTAGNLGIATVTPTQKFEVDLGNMLVRGSDNFTKGGDTAFLYVGDGNHPIEAIHSNPKTNSGGLTIGTYKAPQLIYLQDGAGNVGIGIGTTAPVARLDVAGTTESAIYGQSVSASQMGALILPASGLWGDTGQSGNLAIVGTADDGFSVAGINNSPSGTPGMIVEGFDSTNSTGLLADIYSAGFGGECMVDVNGNLSCTGTITPTVPIDGGTRKVAVSSIGAAEDWFEDAGSGRLSNGSAVVRLEPTFAQTVNSNVEYHVFLTPKGECEGLYVSNETAGGFEVHELHHGNSSVGFDYRIMAKRRGHESIRLADRTREFETPKPSRTAKAGSKGLSAQAMAARSADVH
jgi:hypothetical protein